MHMKWANYSRSYDSKQQHSWLKFPRQGRLGICWCLLFLLTCNERNSARPLQETHWVRIYCVYFKCLTSVLHILEDGLNIFLLHREFKAQRDLQLHTQHSHSLNHTTCPVYNTVTWWVTEQWIWIFLVSSSKLMSFSELLPSTTTVFHY